MQKVFYNPETLEVKGFSDGEISMEFPYVETTENVMDIENVMIVMTDGVASIGFKNTSYSQEEWDKKING